MEAYIKDYTLTPLQARPLLCSPHCGQVKNNVVYEEGFHKVKQVHVSRVKEGLKKYLCYILSVPPPPSFRKCDGRNFFTNI